MSIDISTIKCLRNEYSQSQYNKVLQNAVSKNDLKAMALNRDQLNTDRTIFNNQIQPRISVTDQKSSGRCWLFAANNVLRREVIKKFDLSPDFELSQAFLMFWDKFERFNYGLEAIIKTSDRPLGDRTIHKLLSEPMCDGGQWDMIVNIIKKHGIVPKSVYGETFHSSNTGALNSLLTVKFRQAALKLRELASNEEERALFKASVMKFVFNTLCTTLGTPPVQFDWEFVTNTSKTYMKRSYLSPRDFYCNAVGVDLDNYVCLINDPRNEFGKTFTVDLLGNVVEGQKVKYLNVPIDELRNAAETSIRLGEAVWFGCDVGQALHETTMSLGVKEYDKLLGTSFSMTKKDRVESGDSLMTHAMVLSGFHKSDRGSVERWEVENSWGREAASASPSGTYTMTDEWFTEFMFEVVVNKKYVPPHILTAWNTVEPPTVLPLWDPMGALA